MTATRAERDVMGEILALVGDYDGCHQRVRDWEAEPDWEKEAHPNEEPFTDREDAENWNARADALILAGYVKPRVVTTVAELDALPVGAVLLDIGEGGKLADCPVICCKTGHGDWQNMNDQSRDRRWHSAEIAREARGSVLIVVHAPVVTS